MEELTEVILEQITENARLLFSVEEVALIVGLKAEQAKFWAKDTTHPFAQAYWRGRLLTEAEVRKTTITLAKQGSSPSVEQVKKYLRDSNINNA